MEKKTFLQQAKEEKRSYLLYFLIYCPLGAVAPLLGQYLSGIGFSGTQVGIVTSTGTATAVVAGIFWGKCYANTCLLYTSVIDEEQRFGVEDKETIKKIKNNVDVLTLSATPIPRTLNMSLTGIKDMSLIEEAPEERYPVQTYAVSYTHLFRIMAMHGKTEKPKPETRSQRSW